MMQDDVRPLNPIRYSGRDYLTMRDGLLRRLREKYGDVFNNFVTSDPAMMLVEIASYALSQLAWYQDRRLSEAYLSTARTHDAVSRLAGQLGYKVRAATPASVEVLLTFDAPLAGDGVLPSGHRFSGPSGLLFEVVSDVSLHSGDTTALVMVREGETRVASFTSNGSKNQRFLLPSLADGEYLADQVASVIVDGTEWKVVDFLEFEDTPQVEVSWLSDPPFVQFGDGFAGAVPPDGASVRVQTVVHHADVGNVSEGTITAMADVLTVAGETVSATVTNARKASGGALPESVEHVRRVAPMSFASRGAAITRNDYVALVSGFSDPLYGKPDKGVAFTVRASSVDVVLQEQVQAIATALSTHKADADSIEASVSSTLTDIVSSSETAHTRLQDVMLDWTLVGGKLTLLGAEADQIAGTAASLKAQGVSQGADIDALLVELDGAADVATMKALAQRIQALQSGMVASADQIAGTALAQRQEVEAAKATTLLLNLEDADTEAVHIKSAANGALSTVGTCGDKAAGVRESVLGSMSVLQSHCGALFDDGCRANVVEVPILARGADGFLTGPSAGLMRRLQEYLDGRKEVTHLVRVVSGEASLLPADVHVWYDVASGADSDAVRSGIMSVILEALRTKEYGERLDLGGADGLYTTIQDRVNGIARLNVKIEGPLSRLDGQGNLVPREGEIVTRGVVTVTEGVQ